MKPHNPQLEYEITFCEIEQEAEVWGRLKARVDRTLGLDSSLNQEYQLHNKRLDYLLDEMFIKMGELGIDGTA